MAVILQWEELGWIVVRGVRLWARRSSAMTENGEGKAVEKGRKSLREAATLRFMPPLKKAAMKLEDGEVDEVANPLKKWNLSARNDTENVTTRFPRK